jgi:hypothetical protein
MQPNARVAARHQPSRLQLVLAAAWLIASIAIGTMVGIEPSTGPAVVPPISGAAANP